MSDPPSPIQAPPAHTAVKGLAAIVGFLVLVEFASGILQGYYTPIYPQIAEHLSISEGDINWFEAAQLIVSALCIPLLARLGDLIGHKKVLLISTAVTALGSWWLAFAPTFTTFLIGWALQGAYVVWLPLEIAIIHRRTRDSGRQELLTRRGAAILVGFLELAVIIGAVTSGLLVETLDMNLLLALPAVVVTAVFFVILVGIEQAPGDDTGGGIDWTGLGLITVALGVLMGGLVVLRLDGVGSAFGWLTIVVSLVVFAVFWRFEAQPPRAHRRRTPPLQPRPVAGPGDRVPLRHPGARRADPAVDLRPGRPGRARLRPRRRPGLHLHADRALRRHPGHRRVHPPADHPPAGRRTPRARRRVRARRHRLPAVAAVPRLHVAGADQHGRSPASARAPWSPPSRRPRPPPHPPSAPASRPA